MSVFVFVLLVVALAALEHFRSPYCQWCKWRHFGRCMYNPRAGRFRANTGDRRFDYEDPNS